MRKEPGVAFVAPPRINEEGDAALLTVIPTGSPQDASVEDLVHRLREDIVPEAFAGSGRLSHPMVSALTARPFVPRKSHQGPCRIPFNPATIDTAFKSAPAALVCV